MYHPPMPNPNMPPWLMAQGLRTETNRIVLKPDMEKVMIGGIELQIPKTEELIEEMKRCPKLEKAYHAIFSMVKNLHNWKEPTRPVEVEDLNDAMLVAEAIMFFTGGAEIKNIPLVSLDAPDKPRYIITSQGYYKYMGGA